MKEKYGLNEPYYCDLSDPVEEVACMAWDAALGASYGQKNKFQYLFVLATINLSQQLLSSGRYNLYINKMKKKRPLGEEIQLCLIEKHGLCGNHRWLTEKVLNIGGIKTRDVGIYYEYNGNRTSHNTIEFYLDGKWRYADPTWGAVWLSDSMDLTSIMSLNEILKLSKKQKKSKLFYNMVDPWLWYGRVYTFEYLDADKYLGITLDHQGVFRIDLNDPERLSGIPNFIGTKSGKNSGYEIRLITSRSQPSKVSITVTKLNVSNTSDCIVEDGLGNVYEINTGTNIIEVFNETTLKISNKLKSPCYFQYDDIRIVN